MHRFAAAATAGELLVKATSRHSKLIRYKPYLRQRWNEGITTATILHPELQARGWHGSVQAIERYVRPFRAMTAAPPPGPVVPKTRQITRWLLSRPATLDPHEQAQLADLQDRCPHLDALAAHVRSFAEIMTRRRDQQALDGWLTAVEADDQPELHPLHQRHPPRPARRHRRAHPALQLRRRRGQRHQDKMIKRQMYGRAGFALLRKRVILHPR